jgi:hypothetical protein
LSLGFLWVKLGLQGKFYETCGFFFSLILHTSLLILARQLPAEGFPRDVFFSAFVLSSLWMRSNHPGFVLHERVGRWFWLFCLIFVSLGIPGMLYMDAMELFQEKFYLLEPYFHADALFLLVILFFLLLPWSFLQAGIRVPGSRLPGFELVLSILALLITYSSALHDPLVCGLFLLAPGILLVFAYGADVRSGRSLPLWPGRVDREAWASGILGLLIMALWKDSWALPLALVLFLVHSGGKPRYLWLRERGGQIKDLIFFHAFLLSSLFILYRGEGMYPFLLVSVLLCLLIPESPRPNPGYLGFISILVFTGICIAFDLDSFSQRATLWHFFLCFRLLHFYLSRRLWIPAALTGFVFCYAFSRLPGAIEPTAVDKHGLPVLVSFESKVRAQLHGRTLFKSFSLDKFFPGSFKNKTWFLYNVLDYKAAGDVYPLLYLRKSSTVKPPKSTLYLQDFNTDSAKQKLSLLLSSRRPNFLALSFHEVFKGGQFRSWLKFWRGKTKGGVLVLTAKSYTSSSLRGILEAFDQLFPAARVLFLQEATVIYSGLRPREISEMGVDLGPRLLLSGVLRYMLDRKRVHLDKMREELILLKVQDALESVDGPLKHERWKSLALYFYHQELDSVALEIMGTLREWDSLNQDLAYFEQVLSDQAQSHAFFPGFENWLKKGTFERGVLRSPFLSRVFKEQGFRSFPTLKPLFGAGLGKVKLGNWLRFASYLARGEIHQAHHWFKSKTLQPQTRQEFFLVHRLYERLGKPKAASFFQW